MPFGPYADFDDCVAQNGDKDNPEAYCAAVEAVAKGAAMRRIRMAVTPVTLADENGDGIDDITGDPVEVEDAEEPMIEANGEEGEDFHALMVLEGVWTGDGRWIEEGALTWRDLPLPLMATDRTTEGHMDAILIGTFRRIERQGTELHGWGRFIDSDDATVMRLQDLIRNGDLRGISVDLDAMEYEIVVPRMADMIGESEETDEDEVEMDGEMDGDVYPGEDIKMRVTAARVMGACYDDDTEILTETLGWVRFEDLPEGERVATMNPKSGEFEWQEPVAYTNDAWNGKMIRFTSGGQQGKDGDPKKHHRSLDLLVTPNHRMLVESVSTGERRFMAAEELITKSFRSYKIPAVSEWNAPDVWRVKIDSVREMANQAQRMDFDADVFAAFMGAWLSEGSLGVNGTIGIAQQATSKGYDLFDRTMAAMFKSYHHNGRSFVAKHTALAEWLRQFGSALTKYVPDEIKNMSARQIRLFLDAYIAGDGDREGRRIYTSSPRMAGDLQELAQKAGMWAHVTEREMKGGVIDGRQITPNGPGYIVNLRNREGSRPAAYCWDWKAEWVEHHEGMVRCVTVPNETLYVRRNGVPIWCGNTAVPFPAFAEAYIEGTASLVAALMTEHRASGGFTAMLSSYADIDFSPPQGAREEAERGLAWRDEFGRGGTQVGVARARDIANGRNLSPDTIGRMVSYFARHEVDKQGEGWSPGEDGFPSAGRIAWALWGGDPGRTWAEKVQSQMQSRDASGSITAAATLAVAPLVPPRAWFTNPRFAAPSPIRVHDDGRVTGHVAVWGSCHIGFTDQCVTPPSSATSYAHFLTGEVLCEDGSRVPVGQITLGTGHAPLNANAARAAIHYDHTGSAVADVTAGEDEHGIWVSGALRPGVSPEQVRTLMASDVSGDWRRIGSGLELVAVLAVNVPGFGKVRVGMADGLIASLVASTPVPEVDLSRVRARIAASIGRTPEQRRAELAARVGKVKEG